MLTSDVLFLQIAANSQQAFFNINIMSLHLKFWNLTLRVRIGLSLNLTVDLKLILVTRFSEAGLFKIYTWYSGAVMKKPHCNQN